MKSLVITARVDETWELFIKSIDNPDDFILFATDEPWSSQITIENNIAIIQIGQNTYCLDDFISIWFRRIYFKKPKEFSEELYQWCLNELGYLIKGLEFVEGADKLYWLSLPSCIDQAQNKVLQFKYAKELGFSVFPTMFTNSPIDAMRFIELRKSVFKPIRETNIPIYADMVSGAFTTEITENNADVLNGLVSAPGIIQGKVEKVADVRVIVFGDSIIAFRIKPNEVTKMIDFRTLVSHSEYTVLELSDDLLMKCLSLVKSLGLHYGALDFGETESGELIFFEVNPNGQWGWLQLETDYNLSQVLSNELTKKRRF